MRTALQLKTSAAPPRLTMATPEDIDRCSAVLTLAFSSDPACRWAWPDPGQYLEAFPAFVRAFGGRAFHVGAADRAFDYCAAALWLPPGESPDDEALAALIQRTIKPELQGALFALFERMDRYHPREPHWHLPLIGVDPAAQGLGYGSALLDRMLATCDRDRKPAYLEATSPRNVPLYKRHGFVPLGEIRVTGSPPIVPMLREPRR
jgi:GNAT superfamily N-acetyltransferase